MYATGEYSQSEIANIYDISNSSVKMYIKLDREGKDLKPGHSPGRTPILNKDEFNFIKQLVIKNVDATLVWFCEQVLNTIKKEISVPTMCRTLIRLGFTRKKKVIRTRTR